MRSWFLVVMATLPSISYAARGELAFPETKKIVENASVGVPQPAGCDSKTLDQLFDYHHRKQLGVCGALEKLYDEAYQVREKAFLDQQSTTGVYDGRNDKDTCFTARRTQLHSNGLNATNDIAKRVNKEAARLESLCEEAQQNFEASRKRYQSQCANEFNKGVGKKADGVKQDVEGYVKKSEEGRKKFSETLQADRSKYRKGISDAEDCEARLKSK